MGWCSYNIVWQRRVLSRVINKKVHRHLKPSAFKQSEHRRKRSPNASCSCISCCPFVHLRYGADGHRRASALSCRQGWFRNYDSPTDLTVEAFYDVVRADPRPVLRWEVAIGQSFFYAFFYILCCFLQLHLAQLSNDHPGFSRAAFLLS